MIIPSVFRLFRKLDNLKNNFVLLDETEISEITDYWAGNRAVNGKYTNIIRRLVRCVRRREQLRLVLEGGGDVPKTWSKFVVD